MARTPEIVTGVAFGAFVGLAAALALIAGPADAGYGVAESARVNSNASAKADRLETTRPRAVKRSALPQALEVAEIQRIGDDFILLDAKGRIVYRSDSKTRTTTVAKDAEIPLLTGYGVATSRVDDTFRQIGN